MIELPFTFATVGAAGVAAILLDLVLRSMLLYTKINEENISLGK